jgi:hypothetical protein
MTAVYESLADLHYSFAESILTSAALAHLVMLPSIGDQVPTPILLLFEVKNGNPDL